MFKGLLIWYSFFGVERLQVIGGFGNNY